MKWILILILFNANLIYTFAQPPSYIRDRIFGTSGAERQVLIDGGDRRVLIAGTSNYYGTEFDKSDSSCVPFAPGTVWDVWLVLTDEQLNPVWNRTLGGNKTEQDVSSVFYNSNSSFIIACLSFSDSSCEKISDGFGGYDVWLLEIDSLGVLLKQKSIGSSNSERAPRIIQAMNGDYLLVCGSFYGVSGQKTVIGNGDWDLWLMRLDSDFNIIWQKSIGSTGDEGGQITAANGRGYDIAELKDGRIVLGVTGSNMLTNGTVSSIPFNQSDVWLCILDSLGNTVSDRFAGSPGNPNCNCANDDFCGLTSTDDGGFIFCGATASPPGGTINQITNGEADVWIERYDSLGNLVFSKLYGGSGADAGVHISKANGGGYWIGAFTDSPQGFDLSENPYGARDYWVFKIDESGNLLSDIRFGGTGTNTLSNLLFMPDSSIIVAGSSFYGGSPVKQNPGYSLTSSDYWLVQFFDETTITGLSSYTSPSHWSAFPNPVQDELTVSGLKAGRLNWRLLSVQGQVIAQGNETVQQQWRLNMQAYAQGLYFLELEQHNERGVVRVVKQ